MKAQIKINTTAQDFIITLVKIEITGCMHAQLGGGSAGGGGVLQISSDRNDQMGAKITTPKNPSGFKQNSPNIPGSKSNPKVKNFTPKRLLQPSLSLETLPPPAMHGNNSSHAQGPTPSRTWQVRGPFCKL